MLKEKRFFKRDDLQDRLVDREEEEDNPPPINGTTASGGSI